MEFAIACFVLVLIAYLIYSKYSKKYRLPPGPKGKPLVGNFFQIDSTKFTISMADIGKDYNDAYTVSLFTKKCVIFKSYELAKEAMTSKRYSTIFAGRPKSFFGQYFLTDSIGMATYSDEWAVLKKMIYRGLKNYGTHLLEVERLVQMELEHVLDRIQKVAGKSVNPWEFISGYTISIISMMLLGEHRKHDDHILKLADQITADVDALVGPGPTVVMTLMPWLRHLPFGYGKIFQSGIANVKLLGEMLNKERKANKDKKSCFLDFLIEEEANGTIDQKNLRGLILDVLVGGTGTTRSTIYTILLVLARKNEMQERIQKEIDEEVGNSRLPCVEDKYKLPYTQAFLYEILRHYALAPIGLDHCTMEDVEIGGYFLPKDQVVFVSLWDIHHDASFWEDPWVFNPDRFLDDDGNLVPPGDERRQRMIAFGVGKRQCPGEVLARMRSFLFLAAVLQRFNILPDPQHPLPNIDPRTFKYEQFLQPEPYKIIFQPRQGSSALP